MISALHNALDDEKEDRILQIHFQSLNASFVDGSALTIFGSFFLIGLSLHREWLSQHLK